MFRVLAVGAADDVWRKPPPPVDCCPRVMLYMFSKGRNGAARELLHAAYWLPQPSAAVGVFEKPRYQSCFLR